MDLMGKQIRDGPFNLEAFATQQVKGGEGLVTGSEWRHIKDVGSG